MNKIKEKKKNKNDILLPKTKSKIKRKKQETSIKAISSVFVLKTLINKYINTKEMSTSWN